MIELRALTSTLALQEEMEPTMDYQDPITMLSTINCDIMYYHQAINEDDAPEFINAIINKINNHVEQKHWKLVPRESIPSKHKILPAVWSMK